MTVHRRTATGEIPAYDTWIPDKRIEGADLQAVTDQVVAIIESLLAAPADVQERKAVAASVRAAARHEGELADYYGMRCAVLRNVASELAKKPKEKT